MSSAIPWDVELLSVSPAGDELAFVTNEDGTSVLYRSSLPDGEPQRAGGLPAGVISSLKYLDRSGLLALTIATATAPAAAYTFDPSDERLVRWSDTDADALELRAFVEPSLERYASFDGLSIPVYYSSQVSPSSANAPVRESSSSKPG